MGYKSAISTFRTLPKRDIIAQTSRERVLRCHTQRLSQGPSPCLLVISENVSRHKDCHIAWFEEPVHWYDQVRGMHEVRAATGIRVTAGQSEMQRWGCRDLVEGGAVDILNTDMSLAGGEYPRHRSEEHTSE